MLFEAKSLIKTILKFSVIYILMANWESSQSVSYLLVRDVPLKQPCPLQNAAHANVLQWTLSGTLKSLQTSHCCGFSAKASYLA